MVMLGISSVCEEDFHSSATALVFGSIGDFLESISLCQQATQ